jgi:hypothetical protein
MRTREWFGWETLLGFSIYGSTLRVLPIPSACIWVGLLTAYVISMSGLFFSIFKNGIKISNRIAIFSLCFAALFLWCIFTLLWSPISISQFVKGDFYIISNVVIPTVALAIGSNKEFFLERRWVVGVVLAIFIISCYCLFLWVISPDSLYATLLEHAIEDDTLSGIYLAVGQALMAFSIVSFIWGVYAAHWNKTAIVISAVVFWLATESGARGPVICGILTILIFLIINFFYGKKITIRYWLLSIFLLILIPTIIWIVFLNIDFLTDHLPFLSRFNSDSIRGYDDLSSIGMRLNYYHRALFLFFEEPFFGQGVLSFRALSNLDSIYPHNYFLDALGDLGLVGFFLSISIIYFGLVACWHITVTGDRISQKICAALFVYFFGMEMSSGYFYWSWVWPWTVVVIQAQSQIRKSRSRQKVLTQDNSCA